MLRADFSLHLKDDISFVILDGEFIRCFFYNFLNIDLTIMKIALTIILLLFSFSLWAQTNKEDEEAEKLISNLHLIESLRNKWISKLNDSFDKNPNEWQNEYTDPLKAKLALMDSLFTVPDKILYKIFIGKIKSDFTPGEIKTMNEFFSKEVGQKFITQLGIFPYDPYDSIILQEEKNYFYKISHDFFAIHQEFRKQK